MRVKHALVQNIHIDSQAGRVDEMQPPTVQSWLRTTKLGSCRDSLGPLGAELSRNELRGAATGCDTYESGGWYLSGGHHSWSGLAEECLRLCSLCSRCRYLSLSIGHDHCRWHNTCPGLNADAPAPMGANITAERYRTGSVSTAFGREAMRSVAARSTSRRAQHQSLAREWLNSSEVGSCGI